MAGTTADTKATAQKVEHWSAVVIVQTTAAIAAANVTGLSTDAQATFGSVAERSMQRTYNPPSRPALNKLESRVGSIPTAADGNRKATSKLYFSIQRCPDLFGGPVNPPHRHA